MTEGRNIAIIAAALLKNCNVDRAELDNPETAYLVVSAISAAADGIEKYQEMELEREMEHTNG